MQQHHHAKDFAVFLTEGEAARLLRVSGRTMQRLRRRGLGPPYARLGFRRVVYDHARLVAWANGRIETSSVQR